MGNAVDWSPIVVLIDRTILILLGQIRSIERSETV